MVDTALPYSAWGSYYNLWCGHRETDESWTIVKVATYDESIRSIWCAAVGDHVWVLNSSHYDCPLYYSDDGGATWELLSASFTGYKPGRIHACTIDGVTRVVTMTRYLSDQTKVQLKLLDDNGSSWTSVVRALPGWTDPLLNTAFEMDVSGVLHFAFVDDNERIYYTRSEDWGNTWSTPIQTHERITFPGADDQPLKAYDASPTILARDGKVAISCSHGNGVYQYCWNPPIYCANWRRGGIVTNVSLDGGFTWEGQQMWPVADAGYDSVIEAELCTLTASEGDLYIGFPLATFDPSGGYPGVFTSAVEISKQTSWTGVPGHFATLGSPGYGARGGSRAFSSDDPLFLLATHRLTIGASPKGIYELFDGVAEWEYIHDMAEESQRTIQMQVAYPGPALVTKRAYTYFF